MKRLLCAALVLSVLLCGCNCKTAKKTETAKKQADINGVWFSYVEIDKMVSTGDFSAEFTAAVQSCKTLKITDIFFHTIPFADAYYNSAIYPVRANVLDTAVKIAHKNGMRIHAWINPYRIRTADNNPENIPSGCPAETLVGTGDVCTTETGVYFNPASVAARDFVVGAVRELVGTHKVDGIHFDDYFYPTTDASFDAKSYKKYAEDCAEPLSLSDYRRSAVNTLISGCYTAVKFVSDELLFTVSPAADLQKNYESYYADIRLWCKSNCVDVIIPQLYFGYTYPKEQFRFDNLLPVWKDTVSGTNTRLCVGLACYKVGAGGMVDSEEWTTDGGIIARELAEIKADKSLCGQVFYSYSSLFGEGEMQKQSLLNIIGVIDTKEE